MQMFEILILVLLLFLAVLGLSELLHRFWMFLLRPQKPRIFLVTILDDTCAEEQIFSALEDMRWNGKNNACFLIGVDCGLSDEKLNACKQIEKLNDDFAFCLPEQIFEEIKKRS